MSSKSSWVLALQHSWFFLTLFCNFTSHLQNHLLFITSKKCYSSSLSLSEHLLKTAYVKHMWHRKTMGKVLSTLASSRFPQWNIPKSREEQMYSLWGLVVSKCLPHTRSSSMPWAWQWIRTQLGHKLHSNFAFYRTLQSHWFQQACPTCGLHADDLRIVINAA